MSFTLEEANGHVSSNADAIPEPEQPPPPRGASQKERLQHELDGYHVRLKAFQGMPPASVLLELSGIGARCTELRKDLQRAGGRDADALRTKELDPLIAQLEFQFKIHSRLLTSNQLDWQMSGGQT